MDFITKLITPVILFVLTLVFGFLLSRQGKPYNSVLFNIHKLTALGGVISIIVRLYNTMNIANSPMLFVMLIMMGICVVTLFVSGALMSLGKLHYKFTLAVHRITPILAIAAMGTAIYLLPVGK
jgi:hypothetical protein